MIPDDANIKGRKYIKITRLDISNNVLVADFEFSKNMKKYFLTNKFFVEYDTNIENVDKSILMIPPVSVIMPIAWATGADVHIGVLDKSYLDSINKIQHVFKYKFPQFSFSGKIYVKDMVVNKFDNKGHALLFSGGVDSLVSYIRNKDKKPILISMWGADIPTYEEEFWHNVRNKISSFADNENVGVHFIKSNAKEMSNGYLLKKEFGAGWWGVSHSIILLSLCAPLTKENIGTINIASSHTDDYKKPWGSHPSIDNNISWANIKIVHDGYESSRQDKIKVLKNNSHYLQYLRVCWEQTLRYNCGHCEKCLRTITGLILEGVDPQLCNFDIKDNVLGLACAYITEGLLEDNDVFMWEDIQKHIHGSIVDRETNRKYESEKFFSWFKNFDISHRKRKRFLCIFKCYYLIKHANINTVHTKALNMLKSFIRR